MGTTVETETSEYDALGYIVKRVTITDTLDDNPKWSPEQAAMYRKSLLDGLNNQ